MQNQTELCKLLKNWHCCIYSNSSWCYRECNLDFQHSFLPRRKGIFLIKNSNVNLTNLSPEFRKDKETRNFCTGWPPFHLAEPSCCFSSERRGHVDRLDTERNTEQENSLSFNSFILIWVWHVLFRIRSLSDHTSLVCPWQLYFHYLNITKQEKRKTPLHCRWKRIPSRTFLCNVVFF